MNSKTTPRIVATIASVLSTTVLLDGVIVGMTATAPGSVSMATAKGSHCCRSALRAE